MKGLTLGFLWLLVLLAAPLRSQDEVEITPDGDRNAEVDEADFATDEASAFDAQRHAVVLVGLPGDSAHLRQFERLVGHWTSWLKQSLRVPAVNLHVLTAAPLSTAPGAGLATAESVTQQLKRLAEQLTEDDSIWLFFLGHANYDGRRAAFHLPGPDLTATEYGKLLEPLACREQIVWLTMGSSGWFLKPLSRPGRIVVTATLTDAEPNETEFPYALADVMQLASADIDQTQDGEISLSEFLASVAKRVKERYESDQRAPTEHALLDDDGNGRGTELSKLLEHANREDPETAVLAGPEPDGRLAEQIVLPIVVASSETPDPRSETVHTDPIQTESEQE